MTPNFHPLQKRVRHRPDALFVALWLCSLTLSAYAQSPTPTSQPPPNNPATNTQTNPANPNQTPPPPTPSGPKPGSWTISGLVDFYYGVNFRDPGNSNPKSPFYPSFSGVYLSSGGILHVDNALRFNDINNRVLTFSLGELDLVRTEDKKVPLGVHVTLTTGEEPLIFHATEPGNPYAWQNFHNLYVYHTFNIDKHDVEVDAGIWASPFGIEVIESNQDDNYSRGILFILTPMYHSGVRAKSSLTKKVTLEAAVTNGWNDIANDTGVLDEYVQLTIKPDSRFTQIVSFMGGNSSESLFGRIIAPLNHASIDWNILDLNSIYQISPRLKIAGWIDYGSGAGVSEDKPLSGSWLGFAGYIRYQFNGRVALAARVEQFEDHPGVGGVGLRFGNSAYTNYKEATLTLEYAALRGHWISRLEYRHDHANLPLFGYGSNAAGPDQDTLMLGEVYKF